jgi:hypothetical protein
MGRKNQTKPQCVVGGCTKPQSAKGVCRNHYSKYRRMGGGTLTAAVLAKLATDQRANRTDRKPKRTTDKTRKFYAQIGKSGTKRRSVKRTRKLRKLDAGSALRAVGNLAAEVREGLEALAERITHLESMFAKHITSAPIAVDIPVRAEAEFQNGELQSADVTPSVDIENL